MSDIQRRVVTVQTPLAQPGFLGKGHIARPVIGVEFLESDPFIMLMDDRLEKTDYVPVGGPHPHGGFETVSLVLQGELGEGSHAMKQGDFEIMTAGSGVVHTETIARPTKMQLLQLWLNLPKKDRKAPPRVQRLSAEHAPVISKDGVTAKVYSGAFAGISSPIKNYTPLIIAEIRMEPRTLTRGMLPANFTAFLYVIDGSVEVGADNKVLSVDQVGWLDRQDNSGASQVKLTAGNNGARIVLYAGEPQHHEIVSHGPFISDSMDEIKQLYSDYRAGRMEHISEVAAD